MTLGEKIRMLRKKKYTQEKLAELVGVHVNTVIRWEKDTRLPDADKLKKIADVLNTTVSYLTGEVDIPEHNTQKEIHIENSMPISKIETKTRDTGELYFKFPNGGELKLPATSEYAAMFERLVTQKLNTNNMD